MKTVIIVAVLQGILWAQSQSAAVPLTPPTPGLPVTFSGTLNCSELINGKTRKDSETGNVSVLNSSQQEIIAIVVTVSTACFHGPIQPTVDRRDFLFKNTTLSQGQNIDVDLTFENSSRPYGVAMSSVLTARLVFVQFKDGSTWGDKSALGEFMQQRREVEELLNRLAQAPDQATFLSILTEAESVRSPAGSTARSIGMTQKQLGTAEAVSNVIARLRIADERKKAWAAY
jgi:hypothetical protein